MTGSNPQNTKIEGNQSQNTFIDNMQKYEQQLKLKVSCNKARHILMILKCEQELVVQQGAVLDQVHRAFADPPDTKAKN